MGTPAFAVPSLEAAHTSTSLVGVVSQPDRPRGRGLATVPSPVSARAVALGVPLVRPARLRDPELQAALAAWRPDLLLVAAYGKILPAAMLDAPSLGAVNVHASLLPRHRGAAPVAGAILAGDTTTGVTIMAMSAEMDAGDVLLTRAIPITADDTTAGLTARLAVLGGEALREALTRLRGPGLTRAPQDPAAATYAPRLTKDDGRIRWDEPAAVLARKVRAFDPWPGAHTRLGGRVVKVVTAAIAPPGAPADPAALPGTILALGDRVRVATGTGALDLMTLQMEGRKALPASAFVSGARLKVGARFDA